MTFTLANTIRAHAQERPGEVALVFGERRLTFGELHERSSRVAQALAAAGVGPNDRVAVLAKNTPEFFELMFGASKAGVAVLTLNWRLTRAELAEILADATPALVVAEADHAGQVPEEDRAGAPLVVLGDEYERWLADASPEDPEVAAAPDDLMLLLYSSGTTGRPKGVMVTNENLSYTERLARETYRMGAETVHLVVSPLFHIGGAATGLTAMLLGGRTVLSRETAASRILETIERERITHAFFVPAVIQTLVDSPDAAQRDLSSLAFVIYGASPMTEALLRRSLERLRCDFLGAYGMTETAGTVVALQPEEHVPDGDGARRLRSVGRPLPWIELKVADRESGAELPPGDVGEIWVRSGSNMKGYWNQPELTAQTLVDGWVRTGDGAERDEEGYVFLRDRIKDMIISGGENVYPAEVENVLADHPAVGEVAVIGVPHERWGETVKAIVVARPDGEVDADELRTFARSRLAGYKCPTSVDFVDELPRTPTGKVLKKVLRERYSADTEPTVT